MTSEQLAEATRNFCRNCDATDLGKLASSRVLGVGDEQYSQGDDQTFEIIPIEQLIDMFREEIADAVVYMVMIMLRLPNNTWVRRRFLKVGNVLGRLFRVVARIRL